MSKKKKAIGLARYGGLTEAEHRSRTDANEDYKITKAGEFAASSGRCPICRRLRAEVTEEDVVDESTGEIVTIPVHGNGVVCGATKCRVVWLRIGDWRAVLKTIDYFAQPDPPTAVSRPKSRAGSRPRRKPTRKPGNNRTARRKRKKKTEEPMNTAVEVITRPSIDRRS